MEASKAYSPKSLDLKYETGSEDNNISLMDIVGEKDDSFKNIEDKEIFEKNAMAILFPYIRNIITNITSMSGFPPLIIPTLNINKFYENKGD